MLEQRLPQGPTRASAAAMTALLAALAATLLVLAACAPGQITALPPLPAGLRLEFTTWPLEREVHLNWEATPGAASYTLYWGDSPDVASRHDHEITGIKGTRYQHTSLKTGKPYYYYLVALDRSGQPIYSYAPKGDIPYRYEVRTLGDFVAVVARPNDSFDTLAGKHLGDPHKGWLIREFNDLSVIAPFRAVLIPKRPAERGGLTSKRYATVPVLAYHQITRTKPSRMAVLQSEFELQMAYLKRNRFEVITLSQLADFLEFKGDVPERAVVITFDDGWASTYTVALPVLRKYGFPATLFLTTGLIGSSRKALTWNQTKDLQAGGLIDVQCHTSTHANLAETKGRDLDAYLEFLRKELTASRTLIQEKLGKTCQFLAYPYGATNHLVAAMLQKWGYRAAFTVNRGANPFFATPYRLMRSMIYGGTTPEQFADNLDTYSNRVLR